MNRTITAAAAAIILGAPLAHATSNAASMTPSEWQVAEAYTTEHCKALEEQFAKEEAQHKTSSAYEQARALKEEGLSLCRQDKHKEGVNKLEESLKKLGIKPVAG